MTFAHLPRRYWLALVLPALLAGCATTPGHRCPLDHGLGCHNTQQAYEASLNPDNGNQQSVFWTSRAHGGHHAVSAPAQVLGGVPSPAGYPEGGAGGTPVWTPGQVYRAWTSPWTDAEGYLHSGGYVYFNTPGHWIYGTMTASGPAAGVLHPIKPSELGFKPGGSAVMGTQKNPSVKAATEATDTYINNGITQPDEQITQ